MKKLLNRPESVVSDMLRGTVALTPGQALLEGETVVVANPLPPVAERPVAIISGGGSGHEPAHAGYVGGGMLTAAVAGDVFTSPSTDAVLAAIRAVAGPKGAVLIVKNYTGDRLNFGLAAEIARGEGIPVEIVVVADDVALRYTVEKSRRRGIAGTVLVHKVAGAAAAAGLSAAEVAAEARAAAEHLGSMGVALTPCTLPAVGHPNFELGPTEIEVGLGIHGEPGVEKAEIADADALAERMVATITEELGLASGATVALLVNGLGATPPMELAVVADSALKALARRGIAVERGWAGTFLSALDMAGCSLSLMRTDPAVLARLDAPTTAPAWGGAGRMNPAPIVAAPKTAAAAPEFASGPASPGAGALRRLALAAATALKAAEAELGDLDARAGDGDLGMSMMRAALAIEALPAAAWATPSGALAAMGESLRKAIGGSSGPFYATALMRAGRRLAEEGEPGAADWSDAFALAVGAISTLGGAKPGDRTMLDALDPAVKAVAAAVAGGATPAAALAAASAAATAGAEATKAMKPRLGRASYLGDRALGAPDSGAMAVSIWLAAVAARAAAED